MDRDTRKAGVVDLADELGDLVEVFPEFDEKYLVDDEIEVPVQINGKVKARVMVPADADQDTVVGVAKADERVAQLTEGKNVVKEIYVPGRMVNLVVK